MELSVNDTTVVGCSHSFSMRLLWIKYEGSGPQMHIMQNCTSFNKTSSVHVLQDADAVHSDHCTETKADYSDSFSFELISFEKKDCE